MSTHIRSNHAVEARAPRELSLAGAPVSVAQAGRTAVERLCRPLTAEELQIIRGCAPDEDCPPAA